MVRLCWLGIVLVATALVSAPAPARACSLADGIWSTEPDSGAALPAGSRVFIEGNFELAMLTVDIDGTPATLTLDPSLPDRSYYGAAYRIEPPPPEGSTVTLAHCYDPANCEGVAETWSFSVTAADTVAPAAALDLEFGIYDHTDIDTGSDSCGSGQILDITIFAHVSLAAEDGAGAPRQALVEVIDATSDTVLRSENVKVGPTMEELTSDLSFSFEAGELPEPLAESVCMRVTVLDLAGNIAEALTSCEPHHVVANADQATVYVPFAPDEPAWDEFPDAASDSTPLDRGCACGTQPGAQGAVALLGLGLLGLGLRTRRRRSERPSA
jgi:MYXO-CTERM domain-containing protein